MIGFAGRRLRGILLVAGLVGLASLSAYTPGTAAFTEPGITGMWTDFANCPVRVLVFLEKSACEHSYVTGGAVQIGRSTVPISVPGDTFDAGATKPVAGNGIVVSPTHGILNGPAQPVPGGLLGTVGNIPMTGVSAKLEWATLVPPNTVFGFTEVCGLNPFVTLDICKILNPRAGTATTLSVKIHLLSPFLGPVCYLGSAAHPIVIALTTGTTSPPPPAQPISGQPAEFIHIPIIGIEQAFGLTLVSNSFSVPAASGCGTSGGNLVNASIDHKLGLPSPPGRNAIIIHANAEQGASTAVLGHGVTGE